MGIVIGIAGAHRVGKSTLCKELEKSGEGFYKYVPTDLTKTLEAHGVTADELQKRPIFEFLQIQFAVLYQIINTIEECRRQEGVFVVDRTPIDALAYLWANFNAADFESLYYNRIGSKEQTQEIYENINRFRNVAYEACQDDLAMIFFVQPGIEIVKEDGKALPDRLYQDHLSRFMISDLRMMQEDLISKKHKRGYQWVKILPKDMTDLNKRVLLINETFSSKMYEQMNRNRVFKIGV